MPKVHQLQAYYPLDCPVAKAVRAQHADTTYFLTNGYICYCLNNNTRQYEHRLVAELAWGHFPEHYHVHHRDGCKTNNVATNLQALPPQIHTSLHHAQGHMAPCPICGKPFWLKISQQERTTTNYCSNPCRAIGNRTTERPTKDELHRILLRANFVQAGSIYGVSDNTIRNWCRFYGLPAKASAWKSIRKDQPWTN